MSNMDSGVQLARRDGAAWMVKVANNAAQTEAPGTQKHGSETEVENNENGSSIASTTADNSIGDNIRQAATPTGTDKSHESAQWVTVAVEPTAPVMSVTDSLTVSYNSEQDVDFETFQLLLKDETNDPIVNATIGIDKNDTVTVSFTENEAVLKLDFLNQGYNTQYLGRGMRVEISWSESGKNVTGTSWSNLFAVVNSNKEEASISTAIESANEASAGIAHESRTASRSSSTNTTAPKVSDSKGGGGGGGLSGGAIAGIVIGVVGGLLLIAAAAFFLLRKRRKAKSAVGAYTGTDSANTYMVDKETHGHAIDSPNSPYSDENQARSLPINDTNHEEQMVSPAPMGGVPRTSTGGSHSSRAETPQGVSSNVAHLVEDGMTMDEIRRLEEEERQLDDEIERAARR